MSTREISAAIRDAAENTIFAVVFTKRTTGERREMVCRLGVKKHLRGGDPAYDFAEKGLLCVFDMEKKGYRSIPLDALESITIRGVEFSAERPSGSAA